MRPNWFMQVFTDPRYYRDPILAGSLPFSSGGAAVAWIDARDIAAVVARTSSSRATPGRPTSCPARRP